MTFRTTFATCAMLSLAACQSVHTEVANGTALGQPTPTPTPHPLGQPLSLSLGPAAPTPVASPAPQQIEYSSVKGVGRTIAMTFDDGPSAELTPQLLDILKQRGIHATFFVVGQNAAEHPDILKRMVTEGHEIGNHSWNHPQLTRLSGAGADSQVQRTSDAIRAAIGHDPVLLRPPYGATTPALNRHFAQTFGVKVILWSVDPLDWKYRNSARVEREILKQVGPGGIVLSHDIHATTVAAMPATLDALIAQGYKFATVSELIAMQGSVAPVPKSDPTPSATPKPETITAPRPQPTPVDAATEGNATR